MERIKSFRTKNSRWTKPKINKGKDLKNIVNQINNRLRK